MQCLIGRRHVGSWQAGALFGLLRRKPCRSAGRRPRHARHSAAAPPVQVPAVVRMARAAVASGRCAVIGLQSTGEARTSDVVAEKGEELDDFVSGEGPVAMACGR